jgi:hypothetical protein
VRNDHDCHLFVKLLQQFVHFVLKTVVDKCIRLVENQEFRR